MKTKTEIKKYLNEWEDRLKKTINNSVIISEHYEKERNNRISFYEGIIDCLKWVLEEPVYKRTIYDLTEEELTKLIRIYSNDGNKEVEFAEKTNIRNLEYLTIHDGDGELYSIDTDLNIESFYINFNNQIQYSDTIRNMLSMEKPE